MGMEASERRDDMGDFQMSEPKQSLTQEEGSEDLADIVANRVF